MWLERGSFVFTYSSFNFLRFPNILSGNSVILLKDKSLKIKRVFYQQIKCDL